MRTIATWPAGDPVDSDPPPLTRRTWINKTIIFIRQFITEHTKLLLLNSTEQNQVHNSGSSSDYHLIINHYSISRSVICILHGCWACSDVTHYTVTHQHSNMNVYYQKIPKETLVFLTQNASSGRHNMAKANNSSWQLLITANVEMDRQFVESVIKETALNTASHITVITSISNSMLQ